ncbi:MAG: hypothetical protein PHN64_10225 [Desulfovibrionaceae bacterium]|nr:hypothetical protein [Desulfovibrionaceae bacterium]
MPVQKILTIFGLLCFLFCAMANFSYAEPENHAKNLPRIEQSAPIAAPEPHKADRSQTLKQELQHYLETADLSQVLEQALQVRIPTSVQQYLLLGLVLLGIAGYIITVCCEAIDVLVRLGIEKCSDWLLALCTRVGKKLHPFWRTGQQAARRLWQQYGLHSTRP